MPFMFGPAAVDAETFDFLIEHPRYEFDLFAPPNQRLSTADYAIGLYCARLVRDGGTLQIGIGEIGDAVIYGLQLRQQQNGEFREILQGLDADRFAAAFNSMGAAAPFEAGLYACSEMFIDGFLDLYRSGVLRRRVYDDLRIQRLLNDGVAGERIDESFLAALSREDFSDPLTAEEFAQLQKAGSIQARLPLRGWPHRECGWTKRRRTARHPGRKARTSRALHGASTDVRYPAARRIFSRAAGLLCGVAGSSGNGTPAILHVRCRLREPA